MSHTEQRLAWFRLAFILFIIASSAQTLLLARPQHALHVRLLAGTEIAAALLFLVQGARLIAGGLLLAIFAIAFTVSALADEVALHFFHYAASTIFPPSPGAEP